MSEAGERAHGDLISHIYARIRDEILQQRLRPGVKLAAEHLATMLDVSRTPVRQALERLAQEGYIARKPGRGFYVAEVETEEIKDLYDVRQALEVHALTTAFDRGITSEAAALVGDVDAVYQRCVREEDVAGRFEADQDFHLAMARLSGNAVLVKFINDIFQRLNFRRRYDGYWYWATRGQRSAEAAAEHDRLIGAIMRRDRDSAIGELRNHLERAWDNYERFLKTSTAFNIPG